MVKAKLVILSVWFRLRSIALRYLFFIALLETNPIKKTVQVMEQKMKILKPVLVSIFVLGTAASAAANNPSETSRQYELSYSYAQQSGHNQSAQTPYAALKAVSSRSTRKTRIIREPLPGQNRVIRSKSTKGVIAVPNHSNGSMKVIRPLPRKTSRAAMPNLYSE